MTHPIPGCRGVAYGGVLAAGLLCAMFQTVGQADFNILGLTLDRPLAHEVMPVHLRSVERADLLVRQVDDEGSYLVVLGITRQADGVDRLESSVEVKLAEDVIFLDTTDLDGEGLESLILFTRNSVEVLDPFIGQRRHLLNAESAYLAPVPKEIPHLDLFRDLNGDKLSDLLLPTLSGYKVYLQNSEGKFGEAINLDSPVQMELTYNDNPWYRLSRPYHADLNLDGREDILFWEERGFLAYLYDAGTYRQQHFDPGLIIQSEGLTGLSMRMGGSEDQSAVTERSLYRVEDLDNDGMPDIVTLSVTSQGVFSKKSRYEFYFGRVDKTGILTFAPIPDNVVESTGIQFNLRQVDFNGDERQDLVISAFELSLPRILAALVTGSISLDLEFYRLSNSGYPRKPNTVRSITATFSLRTGKVFIPSIQLADFDGDGHKELAVQQGRKSFEIHQGLADDRLFADRTETVSVPMPGNPDLVVIRDLNRDGREDVVLGYEEKEMNNIVRVLMAQ